MPQPRWLHDFVHLFYPRLCLGCGHNLPPAAELLCVTCQYQLPQTEQHLSAENAFTDIFLGRIKLETGAALYYFSKSGRVQHLIHQLKYEHKPEIGTQLGLQYGRQLKEQPHFQTIDAVVPVPLHPQKQHQRGYNQAAEFGKGIAEGLAIPLWPEALARDLYTSTQTKKSRLDRIENVLAAFTLNQPQLLAGKHLLLVDDVLTTGATLEACATRILEAPGAKVSMVTLAMAGG
ncbi:MAG: ComF family protein [Bacteroidetes bacterium]|nr:MAG: ComF family protein [Bacteroidota bacterium]PTM09742.1 MAG: ComF family protein [Bacteroidota bacterium]